MAYFRPRSTTMTLISSVMFIHDMKKLSALADVLVSGSAASRFFVQAEVVEQDWLEAFVNLH